MTQTCILVLGMHRSGTSALTGVLSLLDVYLGSELIPVGKDNVKGYFENNIICKLNEKLLSHVGSYWDDMFFSEGNLENNIIIKELKDVIQNEFQYSNLFAIKDPRLAFLFPVYKEVLDELGVKIKIIIPYRNPLEVSTSLHRRNNFSYEKGMLLWVYHILSVEKFSRDYDRIFVDFNDVIMDTKNVVTLISEKLHIQFQSKYIKNKKLIEDFLELGLKHHNISMDNLSENTPKIVRDILQLQGEFNHNTIKSKFNNLREEFFNYKSLFYNKDITSMFENLKVLEKKSNGIKLEFERKAKELDQLSRSVDRTNGELFQIKQTLRNKTEQLSETEQTLSETEQKYRKIEQTLSETEQKYSKIEQTLSETEQKYSKVEQTLSEIEQKYSKTEQKLSKTEQKLSKTEQKLSETEQKKQEIVKKHSNNKALLDKKEQQIFHRDQEINDLKNELVSVYSSKSWVITRMLRKISKPVLEK